MFDKTGKQIEHIDVPEQWTANVCFGGKDRQTLFITAAKTLRNPHESQGRWQPVRLNSFYSAPGEHTGGLDNKYQPKNNFRISVSSGANDIVPVGK